MLSQQIRQRFLAYFEKKGHACVPSSSVIPHDDPSLLFINAGMNQFKDVFLGKTTRDYTKAATAQKCIRVGGKHNDLDNVGHTARHLTFFEMLGNFSFGDYFKKQAIDFAWEVTAQVFGFDPQFLWASVFYEDEEAFELWRAYLPEKRIVRMGEKDNFWAMGDVGPCGPCSELYFDKGVSFGKARSPAEDVLGERFLEFWNLVFMQYNRDSTQQLQSLPKQSVDTGAGLERIISLIMGVDSVFETDVLKGLITKIEEIAGVPYKKEPAFHVIADHVRSLAFAIADGAIPSNLERGYVLRKLLRRAVRYGRQLGLQRPFLTQLLPTLVEHMGQAYPELKASQVVIADILTQEEESFLRTLARGGNILNQVMESSTSEKMISGDNAFKLKDTYGLPLEEILLLAKDAHVSVDIKRFEQLEHEAKERSRGARKTTEQLAQNSLYESYVSQHGECTFLGYEQLNCQAVVLGIIHANQMVQQLQAGQEGIVLLDQTPFYAEKGGQIADQGKLENDTTLFTVLDCQSPYAKIVAHVGILQTGELSIGDVITATVDIERRKCIANNHTATHLLHFALTQVLGAHVKQAGSIVEPHRLRFDFNHPKALTKEQLLLIEQLVNEKIRENRKVHTYELSYSQAQKHSDIKQIFGEKYGSQVRVVDVEFSKELCGGTHTDATGSIGYFKITKEGSISSGVRRIEAVTGKESEAYLLQQQQLIEELCSQLNTQPSQLQEKVQKLLQEQDLAKSLLADQQREHLKDLSVKLISQMQKIHQIPILAVSTQIEQPLLKDLADLILKQRSSLALLLLNEWEGKCYFLIKISADLISQYKLSALDLMKAIAPLIQGKGGGKADSAQGAAQAPEHIPAAIEKAHQWILSIS